MAFESRKKSINYPRHLNQKSTYAHFSKIDRYNYFLYPSLLFTHPQKFTLKAGQALYIPPKWWHWVISNGASTSVNFWGKNKNENIYGKKPFVKPHNQQLNLDEVMNQPVSVWNSNNYSIIGSMQEDTLEQFLKNNIPQQYVITLDDYVNGKKNKFLKEKLGSQLIEIEELPDYNIWISSNSVDTGLHYDDTPGLLCIIRGVKEITMYPPSDSKYLHPIVF